jgi:hypothetical protein
MKAGMGVVVAMVPYQLRPTFSHLALLPCLPIVSLHSHPPHSHHLLQLPMPAHTAITQEVGMEEATAVVVEATVVVTAATQDQELTASGSAGSC